MKLNTFIIRNSFPLILITLILVLEMVGDVAFDSLCYNRSAIQEGQLWRLLSGNFIHIGWNHLGLNLAGLFLIWLFIVQWLTLKEIWLTVFLSALVVGLGLLMMNPEISQYVGLSGILHGIWFAGALFGMCAGHWEAYFLAIFLTLKLIWEQMFGPLSVFSEMSGILIVVDAHLYGAIAGLLLAGLLRYRH